MMKSGKWGERGEKIVKKKFFLKKNGTRIRTRVLRLGSAQRYPLDHARAKICCKHNKKYRVTRGLALNYTQNLHYSICIMQFE
jgi:hypothetical protein